MKVALSALLFISSVIYGSTEIESIGGKIGLVQQARKPIFTDDQVPVIDPQTGRWIYEGSEFDALWDSF